MLKGYAPVPSWQNSTDLLNEVGLGEHFFFFLFSFLEGLYTERIFECLYTEKGIGADVFLQLFSRCFTFSLNPISSLILFLFLPYGLREMNSSSFFSFGRLVPNQNAP